MICFFFSQTSFDTKLFQVSSEPVTRNDVIKLAEQLDIRLQQSQAKMLGICPIRRELFTQCFGEIEHELLKSARAALKKTIPLTF